MCGICGVYNFGTGEPADAVALKHATDAMAHRGPDDEGFYLDGPLGLGNRRLSIIDLPGGHQPIANEDESVWITFNGEIYNYRDLRRIFWRGGTSSAPTAILKPFCTSTRVRVQLPEPLAGNVRLRHLGQPQAPIVYCPRSAWGQTSLLRLDPAVWRLHPS